MEARSTAPGRQVQQLYCSCRTACIRDTCAVRSGHSVIASFSSMDDAGRNSLAEACAAQLAVCDSPAGRLGLTVCYDLRFPEMYQRLAFEHRAEVLLVPSAFTKATGRPSTPLFQAAHSPPA